MRRQEDWVYSQYVKELIVNKEREYYLNEEGNFVFTEYYLKKRSDCCGKACRHCPFEPRHEGGNTNLQDIYKHTNN